MSITFCGKRGDGTAIALDVEDPAYVNMANGNARAFLEFLGLRHGDDLTGEATMPEVRRAIMLARATFDRCVGSYTRLGSDTKRPGRCRVIDGGIDKHYFERRLDDFERFLGVVVERGATRIGWG